jgi:hypothetical protein
MTFHTRIPIEECKVRLTSGIDIDRFALTRSGRAGSKPILGKIRDSTFRLQRRRYYKNDLAPYFYGRFVAVGRETRIEGEFKMHPWVKVFMIVWFLILAAFFVVFVADLVSGRDDFQGNPALGFLIPVAGAAFWFVLVKISWWLARGEQRDIIEFLRTTFEAEDAA